MTEESAPAPPSDEVAPENVGRTGYGELRGNLTSMYGAPVETVEQFPENITALELKNWYNYSLRSDYPNPLSSSVEENRRVWQEMEVERMLDHQPTHEVHCSELPDYHYWPMIQNELNSKGPKSETTYPHQQDATDIPRFFKTGVPKTPLQEQDWYLPLRSDGRFDWRTNMVKNGYTASLFSRRGWDQRFLLSLNRPQLPLHVSGLRQFAQLPIHFRQFEIGLNTRLARGMSGSNFDRHFIFFGLYLGFLASISASSQQWKEMNWNFEIYNYDISFIQTNRKQGGFHGIV